MAFDNIDVPKSKVELPSGVSTFNSDDIEFLNKLQNQVHLAESDRKTKKVINELTNQTVILQNNDSLDGGRKFDYGKTLFSLVPPFFIDAVAQVLTLGAKKYSPENWKLVPDAKIRYKDALLRHIYAYLQGETHDSETGLHHLAHATCCIAFLFELERLNLNP